jgi:mRNA interferase RelE/StbE
MYSIILKTSVEKDLRKLPTQIVDRVWLQLSKLATNPLSRQALKLSSADNLYRVKVGHYRVVYEVDTPGRQIIVHYVRYRSQSY